MREDGLVDAGHQWVGWKCWRAESEREMVKLGRGKPVSLGINGKAGGRKAERWRAVDGALSKTRKDLKKNY